jgi:hypothetical protein
MGGARRGQDSGGSGAQAALADTVAALREEVLVLRAAGRLRATIEQAKGVLVERHHITLDQAFDMLRELSQANNVQLIEVAAAVVRVALPNWVTSADGLPEAVLGGGTPTSLTLSPAWQALAQEPNAPAEQMAALIDPVDSAAGPWDGGVQLLAEVLAGQQVSAVTLYRSALDGSLRLVGLWVLPVTR